MHKIWLGTGRNLFVFTWQTCVLRSSGDQMTKVLAAECRKRAAESTEKAEQQDDPEQGGSTCISQRFGGS